MEYVITGGAGFIGSHIVNKLLENGHTVHVIDDFSNSEESTVHTGAIVHRVDVCDTATLVAALPKGATIAHLAAITSVQRSIDDPVKSFETNVIGTHSVLVAARKKDAARVIFASSAAVYGDQSGRPAHEEMPLDPKSPYALHKRIGEELLTLYATVYNIPTVSLRYFNVYGPGISEKSEYASVINRFLSLRKTGEPLTVVGDGTQTRDFVHVRDVARATILALEATTVGHGEIINIGSGVKTSVNDLVAIIGGPTKYTDPRLEIRDSLADTRRAKELLGWEPTISMKEGLEELKRQNGILG